MNTTNIFIQFLIKWKEWAVANSDWILAPYNMTFGMLGLMTAFSVAYCLAKSYKMNAAVNGIMSMSIFLLVCSKVVQVPVGEDATISAITSQYLTSDGLFIALVLSFVCVEINRMVDKLRDQSKIPGFCAKHGCHICKFITSAVRKYCDRIWREPASDLLHREIYSGGNHGSAHTCDRCRK